MCRRLLFPLLPREAKEIGDVCTKASDNAARSWTHRCDQTEGMRQQYLGQVSSACVQLTICVLVVICLKTLERKAKHSYSMCLQDKQKENWQKSYGIYLGEHQSQVSYDLIFHADQLKEKYYCYTGCTCTGGSQWGLTLTVDGQK